MLSLLERFRKWLSRGNAQHVSVEWLRDIERGGDRIEYVGPHWAWPVRKIEDKPQDNSVPR